MFTAYQLKNLRFSEPENIINSGRELEESTLTRVKNSIDQFVGPNGSVDAAAMMNKWFPEVPGNVFISHARADKDLALALAGWLKDTFHLNPFIDSSAWSHADDLLWKIDKQWCPIEGTSSFSYECRNITTAHVHMMLASALTKMMDQCEVIFFLNTNNSISPKSIGQMVSGENDSTHSSWLFHEILMMKLLRRRPKEEHREGSTQFSEGHKRASVTIPRFDYPLILMACLFLQWTA